jgi:uncharacterized protein (DUF1330 family)
MTAYTIFAITITNPTRYADYAKHTPRIIAQYGGKMLVRGGEPELIEGTLPASRIVVVAFADRAAAKRFVTSPEYQAIIGIRKDASHTAAGVIVDGVAAEAWAAAVAESNKHG